MSVYPARLDSVDLSMNVVDIRGMKTCPMRHLMLSCTFVGIDRPLLKDRVPVTFTSTGDKLQSECASRHFVNFWKGCPVNGVTLSDTTQ